MQNSFIFSSFALLLNICVSEVFAEQFRLKSNTVKPNSVFSTKSIFNGFGCKGENISPDLSWSNAPKDTKSFALLVHDPDAPTGGSGWWHWIMYDIPSTVNELKEGVGTAEGKDLPNGAQQFITDFSKKGWGGPCPPEKHGFHHYNFTLYALKVEKLQIPADATPALVGYLVNANSLAKSRLTARYKR